jgi:signal transduction histidine kinase
MKLRLSDSISAYFQELLFIEEDCLKIAAEFAAQKDIGQLLSLQKHNILQQKLIEFYKMDIIDIIEIEDTSGKVILRGHNPTLTGDIKVNQAIIKAGLEGRSTSSYEKGKSGFAIRAVAPIIVEQEIVGLIMVGSLFSRDFVDHIKQLTGMENGIYQNNQKLISTYQGLDALEPSILSRLNSNEALFIPNALLNNENYSLVIKPIFSKDGNVWGYLGMGLPKKEEKHYFRYSINQMLFMIGIGAFIALIIYAFLAGNINNSLKTIISGINGFSFNNLNAQIKLKRGDEFGTIAESFNDLLQKLNLYNDKIKKLQEDLIKSTQLATTGQIAAGLAHEIRNPLSSMKMMAQIVKSRHLKNKETKEIDIILREIESINNVVIELLEFVKPSTLQFAEHNINSILEGIINLFSHNLQHQHIAVETKSEPDHILIYLDGEKIRICLLNIILNAIQAMPDGGVLSISTIKSNDHTALIRICNSGKGIDKDHLEDIFEPFFTTKKEGTGLGLALVKVIIERHYGRIIVNSDSRQTCFTIRIPLNLRNRGIFI